MVKCYDLANCIEIANKIMYTYFMNDYIKEKLTSIRNEMNHIWSAMFLLGGSSLAILFNNQSFVNYILSLAGLVFSVLFLNAYFIRRAEIMKYLKNLRRTWYEFKFNRTNYRVNRFFCSMWRLYLYFLQTKQRIWDEVNSLRTEYIAYIEINIKCML